MLKIIFFVGIIILNLHANICWCSMWWVPSSRGGGTWCTCPKDGSEDKGHNCIWHCSGGNCSCKKEDGNFCPAYMKKDVFGHCIPNPDISKDECARQGGSWVDASSFSSTFDSVSNAYASFFGSGCYSPTWAQANLNKLKAKIKNLVSPKNLLLGALGFLGGKFLIRGALASALINTLRDNSVTPQVIRDNRPEITLEYNPQTGTYEPSVTLQPRSKPLDTKQLLSAPQSAEDAKNIIGLGENLREFSNSNFADVNPSNLNEFTNSRLGQDIEDNPKVRIKIADDLREIFKRSEIKNNNNFPVPAGEGQEITINQDALNTPKTFSLDIPDTASPTGKVETEVKRKVKALGGNRYQVIYTIKPKNASSSAKPLVIVHDVTLTSSDAQISTKYKIGTGKYVQGQEGNLYNTLHNFVNPSPAGSPTNSPTGAPSNSPAGTPTNSPAEAPSNSPAGNGNALPTGSPTNSPTGTPTNSPTGAPSNAPAGSGSVINNYYTYNNTYNYYEEQNNTKPDLTSFKSLVETQITNALKYKVNLLSCPEVNASCPHDINLTIPVFPKPIRFPDPLCLVIKTINNPKISAVISVFANILVMMAGVFGLLTLFKRD